MQTSRTLAAATLIAMLGGCALSLSGPDPKRARNRRPVCDEGKGLVAVDATGAALLGIAGLAILGEGEVAGLVPIALGGLLVLSAVSGSKTVNECRAAIALFEGAGDRERDPRDAAGPPGAIAGGGDALSLPGVAAPKQLPARPRPEPAVAAPDDDGEPAEPAAEPAEPAAPGADAWADFWKEVR